VLEKQNVLKEFTIRDVEGDGSLAQGEDDFGDGSTKKSNI
jgi:hypothetical protein